MFNFIDNNKRLIQIVLAVVLLPFLFFGMESYMRTTDTIQGVATVGDYRITQGEFNQALRDRQDAIRSALGGRADPSILDNPELRLAVIENLIRQKLLLNSALHNGLTVSDRQLQDVIAEQPAFQDGGKFSYDHYNQYLKAQGLTPAVFESRLRLDMLMQNADDAYRDSVFVPRTVAARLQQISEQKREVSESSISPERFLAYVKLDADAAKKYYDGNQSEFRIPEQVRVAYVTLSTDALAAQLQLDPAEIRKYYDEHRSQYEVKETRQAGHILISVDPGATAEDKQKARAKADAIYAQLKQNPGKFAELAKANSQDPGSAAKGGDLGFFGRGTMVKPFDAAVFQMKAGEISPPVESQYGFHIIHLAAIKPAQIKSFDEARGQIEVELKKDLARRKFAELAENFSNVVFEQSESLNAAARLAKTTVQQSGWITREHAADARLNNPKLLQSIFSDDVLKNKRNTEAVEVTPGVLVAARIIEHKPSSVQPFDAVSAEIVRKLRLRQAAQLAIQDGRDKLEKLKQGKEVQVTWNAPQLVGRNAAHGLSGPVLEQVFKTDTGKLPAYSGIENPGGGFILLKVIKVEDPGKETPEKQKAFADALKQIMSQEEMSAYVASLRQKTSVKISKDQLQEKTN